MGMVLADIKKTIEEVLRSERVSMSRLVLFGSRARQSFSPDSDYDFLLIINEDLPVEKKKKIYGEILKKLAADFIDGDIIIESLSEYNRHKNQRWNIVRIAEQEGIPV